jgi:alginate O-acetyltransferase complex protein AlgI
LSEEVSIWLRGLNVQSVERSSALDIRWLGFSYIVFRLIHTIRDRQSGRLPHVTLNEYFTYVIFFPSLTAGPIDRVERFQKDLRRPLSLTNEDWVVAGERFFIGMFKKYVIADSLALIALNGTNALQVGQTRWAWVLLYAYTFQIFFDFSGYTDIVIGIAGLLGIKLPENFNSPYLKPNLTQFWNNWHMTLTQWFRAYYFNPVNRWLRGLKKAPSISIQILLMQTSTMLLIGLWHGITWNFVLWGLWHGFGLFAQNRWSDAVKTRSALRADSPFGKIGLNVIGIFLTFNFVALGWVFFALPSPVISLNYFFLLFGIR